MTTEIERIPARHIGGLKGDWINGSKPLLIEKAAHCAALSHWSSTYFRKRLNGAQNVLIKRPIPREQGKFEYANVTIAELLDDWDAPDSSQYYFAGAKNQLAELDADAPEPSFLRCRNYVPLRQYWMGHRGFTRLHFHPASHAIACQLVGTRTFYLASPKQTRYLYPSVWSGPAFNASLVDYERLEDVDINAFPRWKLDAFTKIELHPGDVLLIPPQWWHFVCVNSFSAMVSFFWPASIGSWLFTPTGPRTLRYLVKSTPRYFQTEVRPSLRPSFCY